VPVAPRGVLPRRLEPRGRAVAVPAADLPLLVARVWRSPAGANDGAGRELRHADPSGLRRAERRAAGDRVRGAGGRDLRTPSPCPIEDVSLRTAIARQAPRNADLALDPGRRGRRRGVLGAAVTRRVRAQPGQPDARRADDPRARNDARSLRRLARRR
jgi:hypothetical protein